MEHSNHCSNAILKNKQLDVIFLNYITDLLLQLFQTQEITPEPGDVQITGIKYGDDHKPQYVYCIFTRKALVPAGCKITVNNNEVSWVDNVLNHTGFRTSITSHKALILELQDRSD
ncbi:MAG: hypothetical protein H6779_05390 [Candidatus Nomurabacteria bacterium]|nr:MAG: hypothetical protein H6779_05390 [Candidatus Nomurabacteria bacterium]